MSLGKRFYLTLLSMLIIALIASATPDKAGREFNSGEQYKTEISGPTDDYPQMPGFPINMGVGAMFAPCEGPILVDLDGDGDWELLAGSTNNMLYAWHHNGVNVAGFPINVGGPIQGSPAVGDIDGDGDLEVVVGSRNFNVYAYHHDGRPVAGWPQSTLDEIAINSVSLWDFDNNGDYEVFVGSDRLYVWQGNGTLLPGFPANFSGAQYGTCSASAVGDIDGDGDEEIILEGWDYLNAFHHNGTVVAGWPYRIPSGGFSYSAPSLVDINGDGNVEIFCASHGTPSYLYGIDGNGTNLPGFPQTIAGWTYSTPAIGDLDNDGQVEIMLLCNSNLLYAFNTNGSPVPGWPIAFGQFNCEGAVALADFDNNGQIEILFGNNGGTAGYRYYAYTANGTLHPDFPFTMQGASLPTCSAIGDADRDGDMEFSLHVSNGTINFWTSPYQAGLRLRPWPMAHHDPQHTGNFHHMPNCDVTLTVTGDSIPIGTLNYNISVHNNDTRYANFDVWCRVTLPTGTTTGPVLGPYNLTLAPNTTLARDRQLPIPATAPAGEYTFHAYVGNYPAHIEEQSSFQFIKLAGLDGAYYSCSWESEGSNWEFNAIVNREVMNKITVRPNPFNGRSNIAFKLANAGNISLKICDVTGREIARLAEGYYYAGEYEFNFDGSILASGIYFINLKTNNNFQVQKILLLK